MLNLIKKEIALCLHPTAFIFRAFAALVFVPNYPYEVIFFFSCLSVFFCCMMTRENGDIAFSCALPVKRSIYLLQKYSSRLDCRVSFYCLWELSAQSKELFYLRSSMSTKREYRQTLFSWGMAQFCSAYLT